VRDLGRVLPESHRHTDTKDRGSAVKNLGII
jgi:hypothetical protein